MVVTVCNNRSRLWKCFLQRFYCSKQLLLHITTKILWDKGTTADNASDISSVAWNIFALTLYQACIWRWIRGYCALKKKVFYSHWFNSSVTFVIDWCALTYSFTECESNARTKRETLVTEKKDEIVKSSLNYLKEVFRYQNIKAWMSLYW